MTGFHWMAFFIGVAFGALVLPFLLRMFSGNKASS